MNERPRGLGRGLSALLGEPIANAFGGPAPAAPGRPSAPVTVRPEGSNEPGLVTPFPAPVPSIAVAPAPISIPVAPTPAATLDEPDFIDAEPAFDSVEGFVARLLPIDLIQRNPKQPRRHFDETELAELSDSIRTRGLLQPIVVRPAPDQPGFEIVAGERRWRAAQMAGLHEIAAVIQDLNDVEVLEIAIIENIQRVDLNALEEANGYQQLIDRFGRTQAEIADVVGKSRPHIANMLRLLSLPGEVQDMVREGRLTAGHARAVASSPNPVALARMAIEQALNVREVEKLAAKAKEDREGPRVRAPAPEKDADTRALETTLTDALGLPVALTMRGESGELKIGFKSLEQLDDLMRRLAYRRG
jgi:ParB family chromosome partitioning protein